MKNKLNYILFSIISVVALIDILITVIATKGYSLYFGEIANTDILFITILCISVIFLILNIFLKNNNILELLNVVIAIIMFIVLFVLSVDYNTPLPEYTIDWKFELIYSILPFICFILIMLITEAICLFNVFYIINHKNEFISKLHLSSKENRTPQDIDKMEK